MTLSRRITAEALGTMLLLSAVVGSGIMGDRLSGGNVAMVLMDLNMPHLDGYQALREMQQRKIDVPTIALTAASLKMKFMSNNAATSQNSVAESLSAVARKQ